MNDTKLRQLAAEAATLLGRDASRLIKLCETESRPRVCFETKDNGHTNI